MKKINLIIDEKDIMSFTLIAAAKGVTPEMLLQCFVHDIVSYFSVEEVTAEEDYLSRWFFGSWFSQDDDGYFTFLHYLICNHRYRYVINALKELRECSLKDKKSKSEIQYMKQLKYTVKRLFRRYCAANPAHKSLSSEMREVKAFEKKYRLSGKMNTDSFDDLVDVMNCREAGYGNERENNSVDFAVVQ